MAAEDLEPETGRDLCRVRSEDERKGYRKDILTDNLSERDAVFFCNRCQGMMREVCTSSGGEQFCSCCKKEGEQIHPNIQMDDMILSFKCSCPLIARGCKWLGTLRNCEDHLDTCDYVYETCKLRCGVVLQRNELSVHEKEKCPQRIVECEHCNNEFKSCELHTHFDKCPKMEVSCELKCGKIMYREDMAHHLKQECVEKELACPFVKYKCELASIKRKYLSQHLEEKRTEHLELKLNAIELKLNAMEELTVKQNETIEKLNRTITEQSREKEKSPQRIENLGNESKSIPQWSIKAEYAIPKIEYAIPKQKYPIQKNEYSIPKDEYAIPKKEYAIPRIEYAIPKKEYAIPKKDYAIPKNKH